MTVSRRPDSTSRLSTASSMRDAIALALDGVLPQDDQAAAAAYRAALTPVTAALERPLNDLRRLGAAGRVASTARFDDTRRLLEALGVAATPLDAVSAPSTWQGIVFIGCQTSEAPLQAPRLRQMLAGGSIIVTSDRSVDLPLFDGTLKGTNCRAGRHARVSIDAELAGRVGAGDAWGSLVAEMNPAVRLEPGHLPVDVDQSADTRIVARDALTDEPLVIHASTGGGQLVHSVAHWWQDGQPDPTALGRRSLASVPAFTALGLEHRDALWGGFGAASVLLACLLGTLDTALDRTCWAANHGERPEFATEGGQRGAIS